MIQYEGLVGASEVTGGNFASYRIKPVMKVFKNEFFDILDQELDGWAAGLAKAAEKVSKGGTNIVKPVKAPVDNIAYEELVAMATSGEPG